MQKTKREGAAGRLGSEERETQLLCKIHETTMAKAWLDLALRQYGVHVVIANIPPGKPIWYPPSQDGGLPGVLVARHPQDVVRFLASIDPLFPAPADGAQVKP